jgi:hypothetical protein
MQRKTYQSILVQFQTGTVPIKIVLKPDFVENVKIIPTKIDFLIQK